MEDVAAHQNGNGSSVKKDKKRKRKDLKSAEEASTESVKSPVNSKEKSTKKKKSKSKKKKSKTTSEETTKVPEAAPQSNGSEEKKKKKRKEKSKKRKSPEANGTNGDAKVVDNEQKKQKKQKKSKTTTTTTTTTSSSTSGLSLEERKKQATEWQREQSIAVSGNNADQYLPFLSFEDATGVFPDAAMNHIKSKFEKPTPIQAQCWPILAAKQDIVGIAETGSGKTLAFLMPALLHIQRQPQGGKAPVVLILSPTRELAMQTAEVCDEVGAVARTKSVCIYGGVDKAPQRKALNGGVHIVVATPGRLIDLMNEGCLSLDKVTYLILDEADRMLDLGFEPDIRAIVAQISKQRQTLMFSATWPTAIQQLASEFLSNPVRVTIGSDELTACRSVSQIVEVLDPNARDARLLELLRKYHSSRKNKVLVFVLYKKEAARVESFLIRNGWQAKAIHGDKGQGDRTRALEEFKAGNQPLLIATDVAARGLDIPNVEYVINYSFPLTIEDYIHRIGRTGRAGKLGVSHTLFTLYDKLRAGELVNVLREANQAVPDDLLKFGTHVKKKEHKLYGAHYKPDAGTGAAAKHVKFD